MRHRWKTEMKDLNYRSNKVTCNLSRIHTKLSSSSVLALLTLLSLQPTSFVSSEPSPKPIMSFPSDGSSTTTEGAYSLFPNEDLRTGRKLLFQEELTDRSRAPPYRERDYPRDHHGYRAHRLSYPMEDPIYRPGDYRPGRYPDPIDIYNVRGGSSRVYFEDERNRGSRYYNDREDDRFPRPPTRNYYDRYNNNDYYDRNRQPPSLLERPLSPLRPFHHHYAPDPAPPPGPSHSKLPVGASLGNIGGGGDGDVRIHVFDPASNSFGNPRNSGKNFIPSSPELFLNHEQYLEYHRKMAIEREQEFRRLQALGATTESPSTSTSSQKKSPESEKVLFTAKQPFDISGLSPPQLDATTTERIVPTGESVRTDTNEGKVKGQVAGAVAVYSGAGGLSLIGDNDADKEPGKVEINEKRPIHIVKIHRDNNEYDAEEENIKSQSSSQHRPKYVSKSGRRLAYEQIQRQGTESHINVTTKPPTKNRASKDFNLRQPLTAPSIASTFGQVVDLVEEQKASKNAQKVSTTTSTTTSTTPKTTSTTTKPSKIVVDDEEKRESDPGKASALVEIPSEENNGFLNSLPITDSKNRHNYKRYQQRQQSSKSYSKGEKLRTEVTKSRIKANSGKIAIIRQQELKQNRKKAIESNSPNQRSTLHKYNKKVQKKSNNLYEPTTFKIPLIPLKMGAKVGELKEKMELVKSNSKDYKVRLMGAEINKQNQPKRPLFEHNDLVDPQNSAQAQDSNQEEEHFTLINSNNEQVDILEELPHPPKQQRRRTHPIELEFNDIATPRNRKMSDMYVGSGSSTTSSDNDDLITSNRNLYPLTPTTTTTTPSPPQNPIKVVRVKNPNVFSTFPSDSQIPDLSQLPTAAKTVSMFMAKMRDDVDEGSNKLKNNNASAKFKLSRLLLSSSINASTLALLREKGLDKKLAKFLAQSVNETKEEIKKSPEQVGMKMTMTSSASSGVIQKVHAHVSQCPKLQHPAEIICDIHIRESHGHPNPQLTVGWRRKFYNNNSTTSDVLLISNTTQVYEEEEGEESATNNPNNEEPKRESLEDFHDKFNVTLAPGINPMLRSVLLIRSVTAPDCGNYLCEVTDGVYTLRSETLLFLCH